MAAGVAGVVVDVVDVDAEGAAGTLASSMLCGGGGLVGVGVDPVREFLRLFPPPFWLPLPAGSKSIAISFANPQPPVLVHDDAIIRIR